MLHALALALLLAQGPAMPDPFQDTNDTTPQEAVDASDFQETEGAGYGMFVLLATLAVLGAILIARYTRRRTR